MGTRAVTNVVENNETDGEVYVSLYRQFDGYPAGGHGEELADFLEGKTIVNGIGMGTDEKTIFNGVGDLACRMVSFFKPNANRAGNFYLIPVGTDWGPDYTYTVIVTDARNEPGSVRVRVESFSRKLFEGTVEEFRAWMKSEEEDY